MSRPDRAVFRLPGVSLLIPFLLFVSVTPLANAGADWLLALYVLPVLGLVYILLTRTVADPTVIRTTGLLGPHRIAWSDLDGFEFSGPRWAVAVALDGRRVRLPMVRPRDLQRLALVSGGRLLLGNAAEEAAAAAESGAAEEAAAAAESGAADGTAEPAGPPDGGATMVTDPAPGPTPGTPDPIAENIEAADAVEPSASSLEPPGPAPADSTDRAGATSGNE